MDFKKSNICVLCCYARMRKDICGVYCVGEFWKKPDGSCDHFLDYKERKKEQAWRGWPNIALRAQQEAEKNEPLTLDEMRDVAKTGDPVRKYVWCRRNCTCRRH